MLVDAHAKAHARAWIYPVAEESRGPTIRIMADGAGSSASEWPIVANHGVAASDEAR